VVCVVAAQLWVCSKELIVDKFIGYVGCQNDSALMMLSSRTLRVRQIITGLRASANEDKRRTIIVETVRDLKNSQRSC